MKKQNDYFCNFRIARQYGLITSKHKLIGEF